MGLDIYSGQLTRYYCSDWNNVVQQMSENNGYKCTILDRLGNKIKRIKSKKENARIRMVVTCWIDHIAASLDLKSPTPLWDETSDCGYYTDKPDFEAYGALVMLQACLSLGRPLPEYVDSEENVFENPIVLEAMEKKIANSLLYDVALWLPIPDDVIFEASCPFGDKGAISTVSLLKKELEEINRKMWNADEATILSWRNDKYYEPVKIEDPKLLPESLRKIDSTSTDLYRTEELAQCAYSIMYQGVSFAEEHKVPILLDY